jgi:quercetin dioxygenase-like cupin family protein
VEENDHGTVFARSAHSEVEAMNSSNAFVETERLPWEEAGKGLKRKILGYDPNLMMVSVTFEQGAVGALHTHPHQQVTFVADGKFEVRIASDTRKLKAGDSFIVPSGVEHGVVALEKGMLIDVFTPAREDFLRRT